MRMGTSDSAHSGTMGPGPSRARHCDRAAAEATCDATFPVHSGCDLPALRVSSSHDHRRQCPVTVAVTLPAAPPSRGAREGSPTLKPAVAYGRPVTQACQ